MKFYTLSTAVIVATLNLYSFSTYAESAKQLTSVEETKISKERLAEIRTAIATNRQLPANLSEQKVLNNYRLVGVQTANIDKPKLTAGLRVFNDVTRQFGKISGNVTVMAADKTDITEIANQFRLQIEKSDPITQIAILKAPADADLIALLNAIRTSGLVKAARIEVIERRYKPM